MAQTGTEKMTLFWGVKLCSLVDTDVSGALTSSIEPHRHHQGDKLLLQEASTSETSVNFYHTTQR
jgi:hypothetical protein